MRNLAVAALCLSWACIRTSQPEQSEAPEPPSASAQFQRAEPASGRSWLESPASVLASPGASAVLSVPLAARVLRVRVRRGEHVAADQPLMDVVMPELIRAAGALSAASIRLEAYAQRRERVAGLLAQGLARASELAELEAQIANARADREGARATLRAAGLRDADAAGLLAGNGAVALRAPIEGTVVALSAQLGEAREPSGGPLAEIAGAAEVQIEARLAYRPPEGARFSFRGAGSEVGLALEAVSPRVSASDGSWLGWFRVEPGQPAPAAGTAGAVRTEPPQGSVAVPLRALSERAAGTFVALRGDGGALSEVPVRVLVRGSAEAIVSGLAEGSEVALGAERGR